MSDEIENGFSKQFDKNVSREVFKPIKGLGSEEEFNRAIHDVTLFQIITKQINEIFEGPLYNLEAANLIQVSGENVDALLINFEEKFVEECLKENKLVGVPDIEQVIAWVEELHLGVSTQLWELTFFENVIKPAIDTIAQSILETAEEEAKEKEEDVD
jgi:hypothetical protein